MFRITNIRSTDKVTIGQAEEFLRHNADPGVRQRPVIEMDLALSSGLGLCVVRDGSICGVSLIYKFEEPVTGVVHSEIGTMRIVANGYGLQEFLAWFHIVQLKLEDYDADPTSVFAVVSPSTASEHNLVSKVGMQPWEPPAALRFRRQQAGVPFSEGKRVLAAEASAAASAARQLSRLHVDGSVFRTPKQSETITIETGWFQPEVLEML